MLGPELTFVGRTGVLFEGRELTFFGGNDYHRLSSHPAVVHALTEAAVQYGLSSAGSRVTTANHPLYLALEAQLAAFLGAEAATICGVGYMSNAMLMQAVGGDFTILFLDETAHPSLAEAALLSGLKTVRFQHCEPEDLAAQCRMHLQAGDRPLVMTDGVFPNTGELAPLADYADVIRPYDGRIHIDDCHALGVIGLTGKGSWEEAGMDRALILQAGTMSKALGSFGGVVAGSRELIAAIHARSTVFIGSTALPLPMAAAATQAVTLLTSAPERIALLRKRTFAFKPALRALGFPVSEGASPICSVTFRDEAKNRVIYDLLLENDIYPSFINYPGCPPGGHFRFTLSSEHTEAQITLLQQTLETAVQRCH
jgi:glycine C-acetyltransferase/8-amino-7-oxononanoate synthase